MFCRSGNGLPIDSHVLRPMMIECPDRQRAKAPQIIGKPPRQAIVDADDAVSRDRGDQCNAATLLASAASRLAGSLAVVYRSRGTRRLETLNSPAQSPANIIAAAP